MDSIPIKVYVQTDEAGNIIAPPGSSIFLRDPTGWAQIDEGYGDRYAHAQSQYLDKPIMDTYGRYNYRLVDRHPEEIPEAEKPPVPKPLSKSETEIIKETLDTLILSMLEG
jgi:hypothetical protein